MVMWGTVQGGGMHLLLEVVDSIGEGWSTHVIFMVGFTVTVSVSL